VSVADPRRGSQDGKQIFEAAQRGSVGALSELLSSSGPAASDAVNWHNPDEKCLGSGFDGTGATALMAAALRGPLAPIEILLKAGASPALREVPGGWNAFHYAAWGGHVPVLERFRDAGSAVDDADMNNRTPLILAVSQGHDPAVRYLIAEGADIEHQEESGLTPLMLAAKQDQAKVARTLVLRGAKVDRRKADGYSALHLAACNGHDEIAEMLVSLGGAAVEICEKKNRTPLLLAAGGALEEGEDPGQGLFGALLAAQLLGGGGENAGLLGLMAAALSTRPSYPKVIAVLLEGRADQGATDEEGHTALMYVASRGDIESLELLLKDEAADVDRADSNGWTALMYACRNGKADAVRVLLQKDADPKKTNATGHSALRIAEAKNHADVVAAIHERYPPATIELQQVGGIMQLDISTAPAQDRRSEATAETVGRDLFLPNGSVTLEFIIGQGGFGKVYRGRYQQASVAIKQLAGSSLTPEDQESLMEEIRMQSAMDFEFVARVYGLYQATIPGEGFRLCMVMEYATAGTLADLVDACEGDFKIRAPGSGSSEQVDVHPAIILMILKEASLGLEFMHSKGVMHRDIKPWNILLTDNLKPLLADFGLAKEMAATQHNTLAGTIPFMAPELARHLFSAQLGLLASDGVAYSYTADWYAFGVTIQYTIHGCFAGSNPDVRRCRSPMPVPAVFSQILRERLNAIITQCLRENPMERFGRGSSGEELLSASLASLLEASGGDPRSFDCPYHMRKCLSEVDLILREVQLQRVKQRAEDSGLRPSQASSATQGPRARPAPRGSTPEVEQHARSLVVAIVEKSEEKVKEILRQKPVQDLLGPADREHRFTPIHIAIHVDALWALELMFEYRIDQVLVDARDSQERTPLFTAVVKNNLLAVELLIKKGASVDLADEDGDTPLAMAALFGHREIAKLLLQHEADIALESRSGQTALTRAAQEGHHEVVLLLLDKGADVDHADMQGWTSLLLAARKGSVETLRVLLDRGANIEKARPNGTAALCMAAEFDQSEAVQLLIDRGANLEKPQNNGATPLCVAAQGGRIGVVRTLLAAGADMEAKENKGWTPLCNAAVKGHTDIVRILATRGANLEHRKDGGLTPLLVCALAGNVETVRALISCGADTSALEENGLDALLLACHGGHVDVVRLMLELGRDIERADTKGLRPLHHACLKSHEGVVLVLLENRSDVNAATKTGGTPLHLAAAAGNEAIIEHLLRRGADIDAKRDGDITPLHDAAQKGHLHAVKLLLRKGATNRLPMFGGLTPEDLARHQGHLSIAQVLRTASR